MGDEDSLDNSSPENRSRPARLFQTIGRPTLLVSAMTIVVLGVAVACGGDSDKNDDNAAGEERTYSIQTFTPTVPGSTPEALVTQDARQTAAANTATAVAENPPAPTATVTPGGPNEENAFRPPATQLSDGTNQMDGVFGAYGLWIDDEEMNYFRVQAPFYDVGENGLTVEPTSEVEFNFVEEVEPPEETRVSIFSWAENSAIPQDTKGNVGTHPVFVAAPHTAALSSETFPDANPTVAMPDEPGRYVVLVEVRWPQDERVPEQQPLFANYAFTVYVS